MELKLRKDDCLLCVMQCQYTLCQELLEMRKKHFLLQWTISLRKKPTCFHHWVFIGAPNDKQHNVASPVEKQKPNGGKTGEYT